MAGRFLLRPELEERKGDSLIRCALGRLEKAGQFSRRVHLSGGTVAWVEDEIERLCRRQGGRARPVAYEGRSLAVTPRSISAWVAARDQLSWEGCGSAAVTERRDLTAQG